jgi:hypothetical protein
VTGGLATPTGSVQFYEKLSTDVSWTPLGSAVSLISGQAQSIGFNAPVAGTYFFYAQYSGDGVYVSSHSAMTGDDVETLVVTPCGECHGIILGESVQDNATVTGKAGFAIPTGFVDFQVRYNCGNNTWWTYDAHEALSSGHAISIFYTPLAAGHYEFRALYKGDHNYNPSESDEHEEPLVVCPAHPAVGTTLSSSEIILEDSVTDQATVTGLGGLFPVPTGSVDFQVKFLDGNNTWWTFSANVALVGGIATSVSYMPLEAGNYEFQAIYHGDKNYTCSMSADGSEPLLVHKGLHNSGPTVVTSLGVDTIWMSQSVTDNATVSAPAPFPMPTGTVSFQVKFVNGNDTWWTYSANVPLDGSGHATSAFYQPTEAGNYAFQAIYKGDSNYQTKISAEGSELLLVQKMGSHTYTCLGTEEIKLGQSVTDNATVVGLGGLFPVPSGFVDFQVKFLDGNNTWWTFSAHVALNGGMATSAFYMPLAAGHYEFQAIYGGDVNYFGSQSCPRSEKLCVDQTCSRTSTDLGIESETIGLGQSVTDNATVYGLGGAFPVPSGFVDFWVKYNDGNNTWWMFSAHVALNGGMATSAFYMPMDAGNYSFKAVYSGDSNYLPSHSCPFEEPLLVERADSHTGTDLGVSPPEIIGKVN